MINLQPVAAVRLATLTASAESLPERIQEADRIYVIAPDVLSDSLILLLGLDVNQVVMGGYAVHDAQDPNALLADHSYTTVPRRSYNSTGNIPSPDGKYYYTCDGFATLRVYTQQGDLLDSMGPSDSDLGLICYGWAWDGSGIFIQEFGQGPAIGEHRIGPLQLLEVQP